MGLTAKEASLLKKVNIADEQAFLEVYDLYSPKLYKHAFYRVSSVEIAQDLTQQVFYKTWLYLAESENTIDNLVSFLYKTLNNLIIDYYRSKKRTEISLDGDENLERKLMVQPSYNIDRDLDLEKVKSALNKLNQDYKNVLIWRYLDDLTISHIAQLSGKSKNAVYVTIHRALKELKSILN